MKASHAAALALVSWYLVGLLCLVGASETQNEAVLRLGTGATLHLVRESFDPQLHKTEHCAPPYSPSICLADGRPIFGTDGEMPESRLAKAFVEIRGKRTDLDVTCMYNPWPAGNTPPQLFKVERGFADGLSIRVMFSDGAGAYLAQWLIVDGISVRTILSSDEKLFFHIQHPSRSN
jgi:hypothetical protein